MSIRISPPAFSRLSAEEKQHAIKSGMALLDSRFPEWDRSISIPALDMASAHFCVIGQVFFDYLQGIDLLFSEESERYEDQFVALVAHGFDVPEKDNRYVREEEFFVMTGLWKEALTKRRGA